MKKTININLGGLVYQIDEDAFERLNLYINTLKGKFSKTEEREEIIQDIEYRFAEMFSEKIDNTKQVVSLEMVSSAISTMGAPEDFEENEYEFNEKETKAYPYTKDFGSRKLFRDPDDQVFAGVISGVSKYFGVHDAVWLRIIMVILTIFSVGVPTVLIYLILWIVMPVAKTASDKLQMNGEPINIDNIQDQVKKNINSDEIKRTTARVANKVGEVGPLILKIIAVGLILFFSMKLIAFTIALLGGSFALSIINNGYTKLLVDSSFTYYLALYSIYFLIATPLALTIYLAIKVFTKKRVNWVYSLIISALLIILSIIGVSVAGVSVFNNFRVETKQTNIVSLENPTVEELNIEFPYRELKDDLNFNVQFGKNKKNNVDIRGLKVFANKKEIHINSVKLDIEINKTDTVFKLSKTSKSNGKDYEDAEERLTHITNEFENLTENTIAIPKTLILKDETKWRVQSMKYTLYVPEGKKIYLGENANRVIDNVDFNGNYSKKDLFDNTWIMTKNGLECITCD